MKEKEESVEMADAGFDEKKSTKPDEVGSEVCVGQTLAVSSYFLERQRQPCSS